MTKTFRNKVVDHMRDNPKFKKIIDKHAEAGLTSNFREHIKEMVLLSNCFKTFKKMLIVF